MVEPYDNPFAPPSVDVEEEAGDRRQALADATDAMVFLMISRCLACIGVFVSFFPLLGGGILLFQALIRGSLLGCGLGALTVTLGIAILLLCMAVFRNNLIAITLVGVAGCASAAAVPVVFGLRAMRFANDDPQTAFAIGGAGVAFGLMLLWAPLRMLVTAWQFWLRGVSLRLDEDDAEVDLADVEGLPVELSAREDACD